MHAIAQSVIIANICLSKNAVFMKLTKIKNNSAHVNKKQVQSGAFGGDWHVSHSSMGMGDYYGTGTKAPLGEMRGDSMGMVKMSKKQMGTPPKSMA